MKKDKPRKTFLLFLCGFVIGLTGFITSFFMYLKKDNVQEENIVSADSINGELIFMNVHNSLSLENAIPTLDKFGVLNEAFTFEIKNIAQVDKEYTLSLKDDNSTILNKDVRYQLIKNNQEVGIFTLRDDGVIDVAKIRSNEVINYSIRLWLNYESEVKMGKLSKKIMLKDAVDLDDSVEKPRLLDGMIPVYYDYEKMTFKKANMNNDYSNLWYDYDKNMWANAVTVDVTKRDEYVKSVDGTEIKMDDINAFWVWIPRFNYEIGDKEIKVHFVNTKKDAYSAFTFNNYNAPGFWISKYEIGIDSNSKCITLGLVSECNHSNNELFIKPGMDLMNKVNMKNLFDNIRKMELKNNIYGFIGNGTKLEEDGTIKNDDNNYDIHMIKNKEWQALTILSLSNYGKMGNNNYKVDDRTIFNNNESISGKAYYLNKTYDYNIEYYGEGASTTGNIYGVYDMAGGKREFVMLGKNIFDKNSNSGFTNLVKDYYYDEEVDNTMEVINRIYNYSNKMGDDVITRGGYKNIDGNILNLSGVNDFINKISNETNSRAIISFMGGE